VGPRDPVPFRAAVCYSGCFVTRSTEGGCSSGAATGAVAFPIRVFDLPLLLQHSCDIDAALLFELLRQYHIVFGWDIRQVIESVERFTQNCHDALRLLRGEWIHEEMEMRRGYHGRSVGVRMTDLDIGELVHRGTASFTVFA
jgi:hypothetical protein